MAIFFCGGEGRLRGLKPGLLRVCNHQGSRFISPKVDWRNIPITLIDLVNAQIVEVRISTSAFGLVRYYEELYRFRDKSGVVIAIGAGWLRII